MTQQAELITIEASTREQTGKSFNRRLRKEGQVPANLVEKAKSTPLSINGKWISKVWQSGKVFNLDLNGTKRQVKIQDLQIDAVKRTLIHLDLMPL